MLYVNTKGFSCFAICFFADIDPELVQCPAEVCQFCVEYDKNGDKVYFFLKIHYIIKHSK